MPQRKTQRALRPGSRVRLHGHVWRVQSVTEVDAGPGRTLKESAAGYAVAAAAAASPGDVPWCVVVGGPNGAGKTTFALEYLPRYAACHEFVNPDLIAAGLAPLDPAAAGMRAGRLVLERVRELSARRMSFGFETTFSGRGHLATLAALKNHGYRVCLVLIWVSRADLCAARVACRVRAGGHDVPEADLRRRGPRIVANLPRYRALADRFLLLDNTGQVPVCVYQRCEEDEWIKDADRFARIRGEVGL